MNLERTGALCACQSWYGGHARSSYSSPSTGTSWGAAMPARPVGFRYGSGHSTGLGPSGANRGDWCGKLLNRDEGSLKFLLETPQLLPYRGHKLIVREHAGVPSPGILPRVVMSPSAPLAASPSGGGVLAPHPLVAHVRTFRGPTAAHARACCGESRTRIRRRASCVWWPCSSTRATLIASHGNRGTGTRRV